MFSFLFSLFGGVACASLLDNICSALSLCSFLSLTVQAMRDSYLRAVALIKKDIADYLVGAQARIESMRAQQVLLACVFVVCLLDFSNLLSWCIVVLFLSF